MNTMMIKKGQILTKSIEIGEDREWEWGET